MKKLENIYIIDCLRTAIGSPHKGLKNVGIADMSACVIQELLEKNHINSDFIGEVVFGNTVSSGTGQNFARHASMLSGMPMNIPAYVVNNVCGSGLQTVILAARSIISKEADLVIAGAAESATLSPQLVFSEEGDPESSLINDGLMCRLAGKHMGEICEDLAREHGITREEQDEFSLESHQKACRAKEERRFISQIVPVSTGGDDSFAEDERPRKKVSLEKLAMLPPVFSETGTLTAGNVSTPSDGACALLVASRDFVEQQRIKPIARILGYASVGVEPSKVFEEGVVAVNQCLEMCDLSFEDVDLFEIVEAFAAQAVYTQKSLNIPKEKMNIFGGDVALGHPLAVAGSRSLVTLVHSLIDQKKKTGLVYAGFGAGGAIAMAVEVL